MKKLFIVSLCLLIVSLERPVSDASEYLTYQSIEFENYGGKLLEDFNASDYQQYYRRLGGRRFWGWRSMHAHRNEPVTFQKETLYVMVNEGTTPIQKTHSFRMNQQRRIQSSASGSVALSGSGNVSQFRLGLDTKIDVSYSSDVTTTEEERLEIKLNVDPMTTLRVEIYGEGKVTNGVARYYRFWRNVRQGGYEVFVITTEYYSIVKEAIIDETIPCDHEQCDD